MNELIPQVSQQVMEAVQHTSNVPFVNVFTIFILAIFVGYYVVWGVTPALHTPLMAVTNALSGIIVVGAMLQTVTIQGDTLTWTSCLGAAAVLFASINIFGGFAVTERMLDMFRKKKPSEQKK